MDFFKIRSSYFSYRIFPNELLQEGEFSLLRFSAERIFQILSFLNCYFIYTWDDLFRMTERKDVLNPHLHDISSFKIVNTKDLDLIKKTNGKTVFQIKTFRGERLLFFKYSGVCVPCAYDLDHKIYLEV